MGYAQRVDGRMTKRTSSGRSSAPRSECRNVRPSCKHRSSHLQVQSRYRSTSSEKSRCTEEGSRKAAGRDSEQETSPRTSSRTTESGVHYWHELGGRVGRTIGRTTQGIGGVWTIRKNHQAIHKQTEGHRRWESCAGHLHHFRRRRGGRKMYRRTRWFGAPGTRAKSPARNNEVLLSVLA